MSDIYCFFKRCIRLNFRPSNFDKILLGGNPQNYSKILKSLKYSGLNQLKHITTQSVC